MTVSIPNPYVGTWTYRSLNNDPDVNTDFEKLEFGRGTLAISQDGPGALSGKIGGPGWELLLYGGFGFGSGEPARFRGTGIIGGESWIYDYWAVYVPVWQNSSAILQQPALVGSITRVILHSGGQPGTVSPAGVVASFYAVLQT
jgi:hypothetical protein